MRVYTHKVGLNHGPVGKENERFVIQTAESLEEAYAFLASLKRLLLYSGPVALLFSGLGGLLIARLSLRPLKLFSKEVGEISETSLDKRIHEGKVSRELKELAKAFNATLDRLEEAFRQQKRFLSDASHEIRTPVSVMKSYCEIPLRKARSAAEYKRALEVIFEQIKKMEILIENLLTLSRLEQKRLSTHLERIALDDLVENTVSLLAPLAERKGIPIRIVPRPSVVQGDKIQLMEVFMNIIDNAIKYNRPGGGIEITFKEEEKEIIVEVADDGIGISNEALPHIFERFYRADPSRAKEADTAPGKTQGAGLGLSIVKEIVENHQGRIAVQSEPGVGSTFSIHLPKAA
ncbi:MAG: ATP-binding protein [Candidatus Manganitrophus sp.]|nr:ATP-binding protein [Candidatus Manganitrophus sp.]MDC4225913.1 ATP-binding protein [Candidatus Manganitrophus sp.]WDT72801.1 MAG: ATP-binding protein [Candidatus Manganitrophus sp.]WDT79716.1 MAG: ATP-binding protein [Candidatus Manganitrophus sp.]